jgi:hypothetical protein
MDIEIISLNGKKVALLKSNQVLIRETQDTLDILADTAFYDCRKIIISMNTLLPGFLIFEQE